MGPISFPELLWLPVLVILAAIILPIASGIGEHICIKRRLRQLGSLHRPITLVPRVDWYGYRGDTVIVFDKLPLNVQVQILEHIKN